MRAVVTGAEREALLREIHNTFLQWPELDRRIFSQAHYCGQSPEALSRSLQLDVEEVSTTLKRCESRLHAALSSFRKSSRDEASLVAGGIACAPACKQDLGAYAPASQANQSAVARLR
jgi:hypothetical protein